MHKITWVGLLIILLMGCATQKDNADQSEKEKAPTQQAIPAGTVVIEANIQKVFMDDLKVQITVKEIVGYGSNIDRLFVNRSYDILVNRDQGNQLRMLEGTSVTLRLEENRRMGVEDWRLEKIMD